MHADAVVTETARSRLRHAVRSPTALVFGGLLAAAVALRAYAVVRLYPAGVLPDAHDGAAYVRAAHFGLGRGGGAQEPPGYPLFLRVVHAVSDQLAFTIAVQHVLALAAGTLFFLTVRRAGGPRWLG